jgi:hypothetical protein
LLNIIISSSILYLLAYIGDFYYNFASVFCLMVLSPRVVSVRQVLSVSPTESISHTVNSKTALILISANTSHVDAYSYVYLTIACSIYSIYLPSLSRVTDMGFLRLVGEHSLPLWA